MNQLNMILLLAASLMLGGCQADALPVEDTMTEPDGPVMWPAQGVSVLTEFPATLAEGRAPDDSRPRPPVARATALDAAEIRALLERLDPLPAPAADTTDFALRPGSQPPPRTGETVAGTFPPDEQRLPPSVEAPAGPLQVLRFAPDGEVAVADRISVTFDRPMVAVTAHADALAESVPVVMTPQLPGAWRWVGTRTLVFEPVSTRLPMATGFVVEVPQGTRAADGAVLDDALRWTFATPPPALRDLHPHGSSGRPDSLILLGFDQRIEPQRLVDFIVLEAAGRRVPFHLANQAEIAADEALARLVDESESAHWLVLRPAQALPHDSEIRIIVASGAPSAEGPRPTTTEQQRSFRTHGPLRVTGQRCGWDHECTPDSVLSLNFSNPLAADQEVARFIEVSPPIEGMEIMHWGSSLGISGWKTGRQIHTVTLSAGLTDVHGQKLTGPHSFTFNVGSSHPRLAGPESALVILDPAAAPQFLLHSLNYADLQVEIRRVRPRDWAQFIELRTVLYGDGNLRDGLPGEPLYRGRVPIEGALDRFAQIELDLAPYLNEQGTGHLLAVIEAGRRMSGVPHRDGRAPRMIHWIQSTRIGLDAFADADELLVWATGLTDGRALADVQVHLDGHDRAWITDAQGLARIELTESGAAWLTAQVGDDVALLPAADSWWPAQWQSRPGKDELRWHVFDDRALYRPGEAVHIKGWVRVMEHRKGGDIGLIGDAATVAFKVLDARNNALAEGQAEVSRLGGFAFSFDLPDTPNLGMARVELSLSGPAAYSDDRHHHHFEIQEFRTPEFEVSTRIPEGPWVLGDSATATVNAAYYAGGPLPGATVDWTVHASLAHYTPPNRSDWTFGVRPPRWLWWPQPAATLSESFSGITDASGDHHLNLGFTADAAARPLSVTAQASVMDVNRQAWSSSSTLLVHPALAYVGLRTASFFVERGQPLPVELIVTDLDGATLAGRPVMVQAQRLKRGYWLDDDAEVAETLECEVVTDEQGLAVCRFQPDTGGTYRITAVTADAQGRRNITRIVRWVSGGTSVPAPERVEMEEVGLIPDQDEYAPGDIARVLVQAPFENAEGLLLINRQGMIEQRRFDIDGNTATLEIPVRHDWIPGAQLQVTLLGAAPREMPQADAALPPRPAIAGGTLDIAVSTAERVLDVTLTPENPHLAPGQRTTIDIAVRDAAGRPVADAEVVLVVVDEAVLALSGYVLRDPIDTFLISRAAGTSARHLRTSMILTTAERLLEPELEKIIVTGTMASPQARESAYADMAAAGGPAAAGSIEARSDFNPLAAFVPALSTDDRGRVTADIRLPDSLTRYRIMAVAVEGATRFGSAESALTARLPLMVRPSAPRFLNFGDVFEFPVVLQNQTDEPITAAVAMDVTNLDLPGVRGYRAEIPPNDRVEIRFHATTEQAGIARYQVVAAANGHADAARGALPVWTPATAEAFATYGVVDTGAVVQPVVAPTDAFPQFGQLEITTSSTAVHSLTDAFIYLYEYPFACSEQLASRLLSIAALQDVLTAFAVEGLPGDAEIRQRVAADIDILAQRQNRDGGFGLWRGGTESWPYATLHVAHALVRLRAGGHALPDGLFERTMSHLRGVERHIPDWYSERSRRHIVAYSLYVRALAGDRDTVRARGLLADTQSLEALTFESLGWLLGVLSGDEASRSERERLRRFLNNRVRETAAGATFVTDYRHDDDYLILHSSRRADGVILEALIDDQPDADLIPGLVHALQAHRTRGRWGNTQENTFVLLALDRYFKRFEAQPPDFVARVWLGADFAGEHRFAGRSTERHHLDIPMSWLLRDADPETDASGIRQDLVLDRDGTGRMYYRLGLRYAPANLFLEPAARGFEVQRRYQAVDDDEDVVLRDDGVWEIRAGARVRVELDLIAPARRHHVALVDPFPAGLEPINPALAVHEQIEADLGQPALPLRGWWGPWYEHQNLRDERAEAFASLLPGGVYTYAYYARATTPGAFVVPPARAEEMYEPETFGRSATDRVVIIDR